MHFKNNKLIENIISLAAIKGLQYVLAFITFPYLVRVLKAETYGLLVYAQSIAQYFVLFTDYGFNLLGPREIARHDSVKERGKIFVSIFYAKILLLLAAAAAFAVGLYILSSYFIVDFHLYGIFFIMVIGNVLFPVWFFQGVQQMRYITVVNIIARVFSVAGIFLLVKAPEDYLIVAFCQAVVPLLAAVCSWIILLKRYPEVLIKPDACGIKAVLKDAWPIFTSTIAINLYTASNIVFLGMLTNNTIVGYFSGAKKIIDNITQLIQPVTQAVYPFVSKKAARSKESALLFLRKITMMLGGGNFAISVFILLFAEWIVKILLGTGYEQSIILLRIMAFLPFIISLSNIFGIQTMLTFGMQREFSRILIMAAVLNTSIVFPAIYFYQAVGVSLAILVTECFVTAIMYCALEKAGINFMKRG